MSLTPTESALIDFQKQKEALEMRAKVFQVPAREPGDIMLTPSYVDELTRPVRLEIGFDDPLRTRQQLDMLASALVEAQAVSQTHELGIHRQRMRMRGIIKEAADMLTLMNGKTPAGKRRRVMQEAQNAQGRK